MHKIRSLSELVFKTLLNTRSPEDQQSETLSPEFLSCFIIIVFYT